MTLPLILRPEAQQDMASARDWYEQQREGLGEEFVEAADEVFARLAATPKMHQVVYRDVRRAKLKRFPYLIYYEVFEDRVEVLAVIHGRRDPGEGQSRV